MSKMREQLKEKKFDERAINYICNFVDEFDVVFGQYVSKEEVENRIVNNLDHFELGYDFNSSEKNVLGTYSNEKEIKISKNIDSDEEKIKSVIFHEMIHCITNNPKELVTGFSKEYFDEEGIINVTMHGFTEGFTEYVTGIRDDKYSLPEGKKISYPILKQQIQNIVSLMGKDKFFSIAFNNPENLIKEMCLEYGDFSELYYLFEAFDIIWKEEDAIYTQVESKSAGKFEMEFFMKYIMGDTDPKELKLAKNTIINALCKLEMSKQITTIDEFNQLCNKIEGYKRQLNSSNNIETYELLYYKLKELQKDNDLINEELIKEINSEEFRIFVKQENYINSIKKLTNKEKLIKFSKPEMQKEISDYRFWDDEQEEQRVKLANTIIETNSVDVGSELLSILPGLAETILKNNWNLDKIGLEYIRLNSWNLIFNLYETNISESTYLGTYGHDDNMEFEEYTYNISNEKRASILKAHPEFSNMILLESQNGNVVGYAGNDEYFDYKGGTREVEYCESVEQQILRIIKRNLRILENLLSMGASKEDCVFFLKNIKCLIDELKAIEGQSSETLEEIEGLLIDVSEQDIAKIMDKITTQKLGLEVLEIEKDFNRLDKVEDTMKEHLNQYENGIQTLNESIDKKFDEIFL